MMAPSARHRRVSAAEPVRVVGGSASAFRRCKTTNPPPSLQEIRTDKIRSWVVGFLGRRLTSEEEDILQDDCGKFPRDIADDEAARKVVQSLFIAYHLQASAREEEALPKARTSSSIQLEAEAVQVEAMAVLKMQAVVRGYLCRQYYSKLPGRPQAAATARIWVQQNHKPMPAMPELNRTISERMLSVKNTMKAPDDRAEVDAATRLQALVRGCLSRRLVVNDNKEESIVHESSPQGEADEIPESRKSAKLSAIPEMDVETSFGSSEASSAPFRMMDESDRGMSDSSSRNRLGLMLLKESQSELIVVTEVVKEAIVIKVQALIRRFLIRRKRRRLLRKAQSIRIRKSMPPMMPVVPGTPAERAAAIDVQRIFRGFVQRWKYWTAMRQKQFEEIQLLRAKQLRKIGERKKSVLKSIKTQVYFDATSVARQLQRAKRVIKFLVKEEKRSLQQNERLAAELAELAAINQHLENHTQTASDSNEALQREIPKLQEHNLATQAACEEYSQRLEGLTFEWTKVNHQALLEKKRKEEFEACLAKVKERASSFLQENPTLFENTNSLDCRREPPKQQEQVTAS